MVIAKINLFNTVSGTWFLSDRRCHFHLPVPYQTYPSYQERGSTYSERPGHHRFSKLVFEPETANNGWTVFTEDSKYYLLYIIKDENVYLGAWVDMERLITSLEQ